MKAGDRVGAIVSARGDTVVMLGYGVYAGREVPPPGIRGPFGPMLSENPKIVLDSGEVAWGCECWWGPEARIQELVAGRRVVYIAAAANRSGGEGA